MKWIICSVLQIRSVQVLCDSPLNPVLGFLNTYARRFPVLSLLSLASCCTLFMIRDTGNTFETYHEDVVLRSISEGILHAGIGKMNELSGMETSVGMQQEGQGDVIEKRRSETD